MSTVLLRRRGKEAPVGGIVLRDHEGTARSGPYDKLTPGQLAADEISFGAFGKLERGILAQPKPEHSRDILQWITRQAGGEEVEKRRLRCQAENPAWFQAWDAIRLFDSSLRLPADTVMVRIIEDPISIPENPPKEVLCRFTRAIQEFHDAKFFYVEPFFRFPDDATAKPLCSAEHQEGVDLQWCEIEKKARFWGPMIRTGDRFASWWTKRNEAKLRRRERIASTELYLEMLRQRDVAAKPKVEQPRVVAADSSGLTAIDLRLRARRAARISSSDRQPVVQRPEAILLRPPLFAEMTNGGDARSYRGSLQERLFMHFEGRELSADVETFRDELTAKGKMKAGDALNTLDRRRFNAAVMLGLVTFTGPSYFRSIRLYDPLLLMQLPDEGFLRLVGHWDRWNVWENGRVIRKTYVHV